MEIMQSAAIKNFKNMSAAYALFKNEMKYELTLHLISLFVDVTAELEVTESDQNTGICLVLDAICRDSI